MDTLVVVVLLAFVVAMWVSVASSLVSIARMPQIRWHKAGRSKALTFVLVLITGGFGGILYWVRIRPDVLTERTLPPNPDRRQLTKSQLRAAESYRANS